MDKIVDTQTVNFVTRCMKENDEETEVHMYKYKGVYFSDANVDQVTLDNLPTWEVRSHDVFVCSYPKAGTTWVQEIMYLALHGSDAKAVQQAHTWSRVPYLEGNVTFPKVQFFSHPWRSVQVLWCLLKIIFRIPSILFLIIISIGQLFSSGNLTSHQLQMALKNHLYKYIPSPRFFKSHLPDQLLPTDIFNKKAKIVYVARNPKDLAVSYYYFSRWQPMMQKHETWDQFCDAFIEGKVSYGYWYEHYLGFWKRRHDENILFLKYEDMKKDEKAAVKQICEFLGYHYSDGILDRITQLSTFSSMKKSPTSNPDALNMHREGEQNISFMRKGIVGDWKNHFTDKQNKAFDALYKDKLAGTGLDFDFE